MFSQSMFGSNYPADTPFSSSKKKNTTPALIFHKPQKDTSSKNLSENNSALINTNRSPMRNSNAKNMSLINRSPLLSKSSLIVSDTKSAQNILFSKSRKIDDQSLHDTSMKDSVHFCENHETRPANYMTSLDHSNFEYFCQKCAILLASQGYKVEKISQNSMFESRKMQVSRNLLNHSMISQKSSKSSFLSNSRTVNESCHERRVEIENFLGNSKGLLEQIEQKKEQIKQNLIKSEQFYGQQIEEVNEYFDLVFKSLELEKNKCYNYILNQRIEVEKPVRMINDTISELKDKILGIIEDIEENIETVYQTTDQIYRPVIAQYEQNYEEISRKIGDIEIFEVQMRKVDFEGVPESLFCISDILKESIDQNFKVDQQKYMNTQLNSLKQSLRESLPQLQPKKLFSKRGENRQSVETVEAQNNINKLCFSFEGQALRAQYEEEMNAYSQDE